MKDLNEFIVNQWWTHSPQEEGAHCGNDHEYKSRENPNHHREHQHKWYCRHLKVQTDSKEHETFVDAKNMIPNPFDQSSQFTASLQRMIRVPWLKLSVQSVMYIVRHLVTVRYWTQRRLNRLNFRVFCHGVHYELLKWCVAIARKLSPLVSYQQFSVNI